MTYDSIPPPFCLVMISFADWLQEFAYVGKGIHEGTIEDALLHFFYEGVSPWIKSFGYIWLEEEHRIAWKFLQFCYLINTTSMMDDRYSLEVPEPMHRNYPEDRETFDFLIDTRALIDFLEVWNFREEIVGTRLEYLLREFCYIWIDVRNGRAGSWTQRILNAEEEEYLMEQEHNGVLDAM